MYKILICDDQPDIVSALSKFFISSDYEVVTASNGKEALEKVESEKNLDLVLMDVMMPVMDGIDALVKIRAITNIPVILLTAKGEDSDKIIGLNVGADDYITKPYNSSEVLARVKAQIRRFRSLGGGSDTNADLMVNGGIVIDDRRKSVEVDGEAINLTPKEYDILKFFMKNIGKVYSPRDIYREVWANDPYGAENTVTVHIRHLREKVEINPAEPRYIKVAWGHGYRMEDYTK